MAYRLKKKALEKVVHRPHALSFLTADKFCNDIILLTTYNCSKKLSHQLLDAMYLTWRLQRKNTDDAPENEPLARFCRCHSQNCASPLENTRNCSAKARTKWQRGTPENVHIF